MLHSSSFVILVHMRLLLWTIALACLSSLLVGVLMSAFLHESIPLLGSWVRLELAHNAGIAFGIAFPTAMQFALILGAFGAVMIMALRGRQQMTERIGFGLILGGALANLLDRLPDGVVTDFFAVRGFSIFNLADTWITVGAGLLLLEVVFTRRKAARLARSPIPDAQSAAVSDGDVRPL